MEVVFLKEFYTLEEVGEILKISVITLRKYIKQGKIKAIKIGKHWRVTEDNLQAFLDSLEKNNWR